ncbi:MAG TPA: hypothetical protein VK804_13035 [Bradyrhizobium sp.]|uniref:hypothetical protein n=1 Tax=Bradyrhizobium sp. TaxID=376 RepID=UPI002CF3523B|nr:hypothetical protein [Bradyrhizobium sp.]HTB01396.1 hypothetical protein [Bradyrhizobium sp.]
MAEKDDFPINFAEAVQQQSMFAVYGVPIKDASLGDFSRLVSPGLTRLAQIKAYAVGEFCLRLPKPVVMLVPGDGIPTSDPCARPKELKWSVLPADKTVAMSMSTGTFGDVLDDVATKGIDGGLTLENPRIQDGKACVDIHAWAKIEIFGAHVDFDQRIPVCIPLEGCQTVYDVGWANVQVCFRAPNQICAKLCIGKWGLSKCWEYCVPVHLVTAAAAKPCKCHSE